MHRTVVALVTILAILTGCSGASATPTAAPVPTVVPEPTLTTEERALFAGLLERTKALRTDMDTFTALGQDIQATPAWKLRATTTRQTAMSSLRVLREAELPARYGPLGTQIRDVVAQCERSVNAIPTNPGDLSPRAISSALDMSPDCATWLDRLTATLSGM